MLGDSEYNLYVFVILGLIAFLLFGLKGEAMLAELLTDCAILLQHDLLVLG